MRPTYASVSLDAITGNYQLAEHLAPASRSIAVIKANAYGHGMTEVARHLQDNVAAFAVAFIDEAVQLRDAGISKPILVLQGIHSAQEIDAAVAGDFWLMLHHQRQVEWLLTSRHERPLRVWLKLDTGMHRFGLAVDALDRVCAELASSARLKDSPVLCTHLACADDLDDPMTRRQLDIINTAAGRLGLAKSVANSAGILHWPETHSDWNRPGYMLYGYCPTGSFGENNHGLRPAMTMHSEIVAIREVKAGEGVGYGQDWVAARDSKIGTIAIGYGDGYPRHAPSGTPVLVNGRRAPLAGRVSMDAICVDLSDLGTVKVGDPVELWGQGLSVNEVAAAAGTIGYEILAGLTGRAPLFYQP